VSNPGGPLGLEPLERRSLPDEIRDRLMTLIRSGDLPPGQQLPAERVLCAELTVARTSVREAIQALVSLGYVERRGNRAYVVEHLPEVANVIDSRKTMVRDLFETRRVIEVQMAELATCRATAAQRDELARLAEQFTTTMKLDDFRHLDRRFHWLIASACGNPLLTELYGKVLDALFGSTEFHELLYAGHNRREVATIVERSGQQHRSIASAIGSGEPIAVIAAVDEHLNDVGQRILERLR
jgi:GntR family transcriptional regulator, transcriptional repressor for pyruvate dehydrogenase complex